MKKQTFADKMARKAFNNGAVKKSWEEHVKAFGPILEPAFPEDYQTRVHLTAALNHISRGEVNKGFDKLYPLQDACVTDTDKAAWLFCMGLGFEMAGAQNEMLVCYQQAGDFHHKFYLPYLKVAKCAFQDGALDAAEKNFRAAIGCLCEEDTKSVDQIILGSAYANLGACLTMMHRFEEAGEAMDSSEEIMPMLPGRMASKAILFAAMGQGEKALELMEKEAEQLPEVGEQVRENVRRILNGTHPHFAAVALDDDRVTEFWDWFGAEEKFLSAKLDTQAYDDVFPLIQQRLKAVFPFLERDPELAFQPEEDGVEIAFADFYMVSLRQGYERLVAACPEDIKARWRFAIVR